MLRHTMIYYGFTLLCQRRVIFHICCRPLLRREDVLPPFYYVETFQRVFRQVI